MADNIAAIPEGSWVLITGLNGYIATHIASQFLERGYKVRGTVRNLAANTWLQDDLFATYAEKKNLEVVQIPDITVENAFDEAVKGVSAIVHVAVAGAWQPNPNDVIPQTIASVNNLLKSAAREASVQRFVYTGSLGGVAMVVPNKEVHIDKDTWNDEAIKEAWAPPPYEPSRGKAVYCASKAEGERAMWKFAEEFKPGFAVNSVLPATVLGKKLYKGQQGKTADMVMLAYQNDKTPISYLPASIYINVLDVALLHLAAVLDPEVKNERIHAWGIPFTWGEVADILRKEFPDRKFDEWPDMGRMLLTTDESLQLKLLKKWGNQDGWIPLEDGVRQSLEGQV
ncbi:hypothetical protein F5884DRAFT_229541 [Xylogone sp. PMI_703]|nr:hypothetical protein F5884DRAFT_229541 [Xylogone sp. PMI_703]